jgi:hypothetical protein
MKIGLYRDDSWQMPFFSTRTEPEKKDNKPKDKEPENDALLKKKDSERTHPLKI